MVWGGGKLRTAYSVLRAPALGARRYTVRSTQCAVALLAVAGCSEGRSSRLCAVEQLEVMWPATIERDGVTTSAQLSATLTPTNVTPEVFDSLTRTLVRGRSGGGAVVLWSVPAFDTDPGGIAVAHKSALSRGEVMRVDGALDGGAWALVPPDSLGPGARAAVEAGEFVASDVSGTIAVLETEPVALRLDLTARDSTGATIRVRGDARFGHRRERRRCERSPRGGEAD
jgi:hypothetical protein